MIRTKTRKEWEDFFRESDCCFEPVLELDEVIRHPQFIHRKIFGEMDHSVEGRIKQIEFPVKLSETPGKSRTPPPLPGEHTEAVLESIGYSKKEMEDFRRKRVI